LLRQHDLNSSEGVVPVTRRLQFAIEVLLIIVGAAVAIATMATHPLDDVINCCEER
jgi:hypothetical protein